VGEAGFLEGGKSESAAPVQKSLVSSRGLSKGPKTDRQSRREVAFVQKKGALCSGLGQYSWWGVRNDRQMRTFLKKKGLRKESKSKRRGTLPESLGVNRLVLPKKRGSRPEMRSSRNVHPCRKTGERTGTRKVAFARGIRD